MPANDRKQTLLDHAVVSETVELVLGTPRFDHPDLPVPRDVDLSASRKADGNGKNPLPGPTKS